VGPAGPPGGFIIGVGKKSSAYPLDSLANILFFDLLTKFPIFVRRGPFFEKLNTENGYHCTPLV